MKVLTVCSFYTCLHGRMWCLAYLACQYTLVLGLLSKRFGGSLFAASYLNEKKKLYILRKDFVLGVVVLLVQHDSVAESATFRR